jgi:hypothetical protein
MGRGASWMKVKRLSKEANTCLVSRGDVARNPDA